MKKISLFGGANLCLILFFFTVSAQDFKTVQDGVEYAEMTREIGQKPVRMNLLRLDLTKVRLDVVHALDAAIGVEKTSSIATRHGALAAINAGFFRLDTSIFAGDAVGVLKINNEVWSDPTNNRIALFIENDGSQTKVSFDHLKFFYRFEIKKTGFDVSGINRERKNDEIILFNPKFQLTTLTNNDGVEIVIRNNKIAQIIDGKGSNSIPADGVILSATGKMREKLLRVVKIGLKVKQLSFFMDPGEFEKGVSEYQNVPQFLLADDVVAGVPQLIKNGRIEITWEQEKSSKAFVETRHPRTAVAKLKDGKFLMVTVDGRSEESAGIGLEELAKLLLEFGAVDAMNLDGGGSTTMFLNGKVVNRPSDKEGERRVSDAILVFPRRSK
jgi:exopolysaccharide biosynthesis protein